MTRKKRLTKEEAKLAQIEAERNMRIRWTAEGDRQGYERAKREAQGAAQQKVQNVRVDAIRAFSQAVEAAARAVISICDDGKSL